MINESFEPQLQKGYGLTTANILYRLPDHPSILQEFLWQQYDLAPDFPRLFLFLDFWGRKIEGSVHSVEIVHKELIGPTEWRSVRGIHRLN